MMTEISLNILDIAQNSVRAGASLIKISLCVNPVSDLMTVIIEDNGCGMTEEQMRNAQDPFFTTRTTRKIGLGISFFKMAAEMAGGSFHMSSEPNVGTVVTATFVLSNIDRMPLGDITSTIHNLVVYHPEIDFLYTYQYNESSFTMDTREFKEILGDVPFSNPEVSNFIREYLTENKEAADGGAII